MTKTVDKISKLIDPLYFKWIRESVIKHGRINIQALSEKFGILPGNTYFRNFIKNKNQDYIGITGLSSILNTCGYTLKLVPIKKTDIQTINNIENITKNSFSDIRDIVSDYAETTKRLPKKIIKNKPKKIIKSNLINDNIMNSNENVHENNIDDLFDDELIVSN